jgi:hypothetical protein
MSSPADARSLVTAETAASVIGGSPMKVTQPDGTVQYALLNGDNLSVSVTRQ